MTIASVLNLFFGGFKIHPIWLKMAEILRIF